MYTAHIFISGFVQGVGFRQFIRHHAQKLGITGWVKNLPDARVEAFFQGTKKNIDHMISLCKKGTIVSEVENVYVDWEDTTQQFTTFEVR